MEFLLVIVAAVSLALAAIMSTVAWRLLRDSKVRTTNRADALIALLHATEKPAPRASADSELKPAKVVTAETPIAPTTPVVAEHLDEQVAKAQPSLAKTEAPRVAAERPEVRQRPEPRTAAPVADAPLRAQPIRRIEDDSVTASWDHANVGRGLNRTTPGDEPAADGMFASDEPRQMSMGRWISLAAAGLAILIGAGTVYAVSTGSWPISGSGDRQGTVTSSARSPLELLSLRHATDETGAFVVTGLVQNPPEGATLRGIVATVYLFDSQGRYFASGRAKIEVTSLGAGEESPFVVKIPQTAGVGRYRVGFRLDDGGVVAHVDRRGQTPSGTSGDTIGDNPGVVTPTSTPRRSEG
jgi:hypothetical protein